MVSFDFTLAPYPKTASMPIAKFLFFVITPNTPSGDYWGSGSVALSPRRSTPIGPAGTIAVMVV